MFNYHLLLPEIFLTTVIVFLLTFGLFYKNKFHYLAVITLIWVFILLFNIPSFSSISDIFLLNSFNNFIKLIIVVSSIIYLFLLNKYQNFEFIVLILISLLGLFLLVSANNLLVFYLAIETISLSFYILAAINKNNSFSTEAGLKYFILGALSSGLLLFGCALIYFSTGFIDFSSLSHLAISNSFLIGSIFIIVALLFKIAAAPFHMWIPDVYEGSPLYVTFFFATIPKIGILYIFYYFIFHVFYNIFDPNIQSLLIFSSLLSITIGTFGAIYQNKIIRLIAFSAVAHIGFILLGFSTGSFISIYSSFIYIIIYIIMSFFTFSFILSLNNKYFADLLSLSKINPVLAISFAFSLLSIAGIPPLAGFFSKFYILYSLVENNLYIVALFAIILSVVASYYYIRIIQWMFFNSSTLFNTYFSLSSLPGKITTAHSIILGSTTYFILTFLFYPKPLLLLTFDLLCYF